MRIRALCLVISLFACTGFCPAKGPNGLPIGIQAQKSDTIKLCDILGSGQTIVDTTNYPNFTDNPLLTTQMRQLMFPYLLPLDHPLKPILDEILGQTESRVIEDEASLTKAGFSILFSQKRSLIIVAKHPRVSGYLFKIYLDSRNVHKNGRSGWELFTTRCFVAQKIKSIIKKEGIRHFTVADKWLFPLPVSQKQVRTNLEPVILVVKDMNIYNRQISKKAYQTKPTKRVLRELYAILGRGYGSSYLHANIPYSKNKTFAFIDTEYNKRKISLGHVRTFLSPRMQKYWDKLMQGKPKQTYNNARIADER